MGRKPLYFTMMGTCLVLIVTAWGFVWRIDVTAAVVMSVVAMVIPPFAAVVGNGGVGRRDPDDPPGTGGHHTLG